MITRFSFILHWIHLSFHDCKQFFSAWLSDFHFSFPNEWVTCASKFYKTADNEGSLCVGGRRDSKNHWQTSKSSKRHEKYYINSSDPWTNQQNKNQINRVENELSVSVMLKNIAWAHMLNEPSKHVFLLNFYRIQFIHTKFENWTITTTEINVIRLFSAFLLSFLILLLFSKIEFHFSWYSFSMLTKSIDIFVFQMCIFSLNFTSKHIDKHSMLNGINKKAFTFMQY